MAIRYVDRRAHLGQVVSAVDGAGALLTGTHTQPPGRTGVITTQTEGLAASMSGVFQASIARSGTIVSTLGGASSVLSGSSTAPIVVSGAPAVLYTDVTGGPTTGGENNAGCFLRIFGVGFGSSGLGSTIRVFIGSSEVASYRTLGAARGLPWMQEIAVQVGSLGGQSGALPIRVQVSGVDSNTNFTFTPRAGRIVFVNPSNWSAAISGRTAGDHIYFRAGTYTGVYSEGWNFQSFCDLLGSNATVAQPIYVIGYPGENAVLQADQAANGDRSPFNLGDGGPPGNNHCEHNFGIMNLHIIGRGDCVFGGGYTPDSSRPEAGATNVRVVNNLCQITDGTSNTMTGLIAFQGDNWKVLGNRCVDPAGRVFFNNNHSIYCQSGADDFEVAYNYIDSNTVGHVIQVHQDGTPMLYTNGRIYGNYIRSNDATRMRGISCVNIDDASTIHIYDNVLYNIGADFSAVAAYRGFINIFNNTFVNIRAGVINVNGQYGGTRSVAIRNNISIPLPGYDHIAFDNGGTAAHVSACTNNCFNGATPPAIATGTITADPQLINPAAHDFGLNAGSPCRNAGSSAVSPIVSIDMKGRPRPAEGVYDIGALEYAP